MIPSPKQRGYSLVELIVSVAIFSIVMLVAGAAFLSLINLDRQARATNDVVTNLSYVVESMERSIRTGTVYSGGGSNFSFTDAEGRTVQYRLSNAQIQQQINTGGWIPLTDPRVRVESLAFYVRGADPNDTYQPGVLFTLKGSVRPDAKSAPVEFLVESGAAQRLLDLPPSP
jgi:prepilin-type N-terminal cleavage/methylation domain-containing protein